MIIVLDYTLQNIPLFTRRDRNTLFPKSMNLKTNRVYCNRRDHNNGSFQRQHLPPKKDLYDVGLHIHHAKLPSQIKNPYNYFPRNLNRMAARNSLKWLTLCSSFPGIALLLPYSASERRNDPDLNLMTNFLISLGRYKPWVSHLFLKFYSTHYNALL